MDTTIITSQLVPGQEMVSDDGRRWVVDESGELIPMS